MSMCRRENGRRRELKPEATRCAVITLKDWNKRYSCRRNLQSRTKIVVLTAIKRKYITILLDADRYIWPHVVVDNEREKVVPDPFSLSLSSNQVNPRSYPAYPGETYQNVY